MRELQPREPRVKPALRHQFLVRALLDEDPEHIYHAAMMDPHTGAELDLDQIWTAVDRLIEAHGAWLPDWLHGDAMRVAAQ